MSNIEVTDKVKIVSAGPNEQNLLNQTGKVVMLIDGTKCFVALDSGEMAEVDISQLKKVG